MHTVSNTPPPYMRKCKRHGVFYNHEKFDSCAVCRASSTEPRLVLSRILMAVMGALLVGSGLYLVSGPAVAMLAHAGDDALARTESTIRIDPAAVNTEIAGMDDIMDGLATETTLADAARAVTVLADAVGNLQGPPPPLLGRFKTELMRFNERIMSSTESPDIASARADWQDVRARVFGTN